MCQGGGTPVRDTKMLQYSLSPPEQQLIVQMKQVVVLQRYLRFASCKIRLKGYSCSSGLFPCGTGLSGSFKSPFENGREAVFPYKKGICKGVSFFETFWT